MRILNRLLLGSSLIQCNFALTLPKIQVRQSQAVNSTVLLTENTSTSASLAPDATPTEAIPNLTAANASATSPTSSFVSTTSKETSPTPSSSRRPTANVSLADIGFDPPDNELLFKPYWTLAHLDEPDCEYPDRNEWALVSPPTDEYGDPIEEPSIYLWNQLRMDEWLETCFSTCKYLGKITIDGHTAAPWSQQMARYFIGSTTKTIPTPQCDNFRCRWDAFGDGEKSRRGPLYTSGETPVLKAGATAEDYEGFRRWYALKSLANVWDYRKAVQRMVEQAVPIIGTQIPNMINTFLPDYQPPVPPASPLIAILDLVAGITSFTPLGPAINIAISSAKIAVDMLDGGKDELGQFKAITKVKSSLVQLQDQNENDKRKGMSEEDRIKLGAAVRENFLSFGNAVRGTLRTGAAIKQLIKVSTDKGKPEQWNPSLPIKFSDLSMEFGAMFGQLASALDDVNRQSLNGDPFGDNGWFTLVQGGLFAGKVDMDKTSITDQSLQEALPRYIAFIEDKMLQMLMKSQRFFLYKAEFGTRADCDNWYMPKGRDAEAGAPYGNLNWAGIQCETVGSKHYQYIPLTGELGVERTPHATIKKVVELKQTWPMITQERIAKLRGPTTRAAYPITLSDIYRRSEECHQLTIRNQMLIGDTTPRCDGTTSLDVWPAPRPTTFDGKYADLLDATCHWSIPIIDPTIPQVAISCMAPYQNKNGTFDFLEKPWTGPGTHLCTASGLGTFEVLKSGGGIPRAGAAMVGPAAWYGRAMFYPQGECTCGHGLGRELCAGQGAMR